MSDQKDLDFLRSVVRPFFKQAHVKKTLLAIFEEKITGWEKWLQIELATYLREHESIKNWGREVQHKLDKRSAKSKNSCAIDFVIHQKHKHSNLALEIKQGKSMAGCVQGMLRDLLKVNKIKNSQFESRGVWCLGIHPAAIESEVFAEVRYYAQRQGLMLNEKCIATEKIGKTGFSFTVL
jgi:hypothetical protein